MKLFAVMNSNSDSDYPLATDFHPGGSGDHSGGVVVIAESLERARELVHLKIKIDNKYESYKKKSTGALVEIALDSVTEGLLLFADGDC